MTLVQQSVPVENNYYMPNWCSVVMPEEGTNLITNPSFEIDTTNYTAVGGSTALDNVLDEQRRGAYSLEITPTVSTLSGVYFGTITLVAGEVYTFSVDLLGIPGHVYNIFVATTGGMQLGSSKEVIGTGRWQRISITYVENSGASRRFYLLQDAADTRIFYTDGWQVENKSHPTTYIDGDLEGFVTNELAYVWNGIRHASSSTRFSTTRSGGRIVPLSDYGFELLGVSDLGMPPIKNFSQALNDGGAYYQNTIEDSRRFSLLGDISSPTFSGIMSFRKLLENAFSYDLTPYRQPLLLHMQQTDENGCAITESIFIKCLYDSGLEGMTDNYNTEKLKLDFVAYDKHSIFAEGNEAIEVDHKEAMALGTLAKYDKDGTWETYDRGAYDASNGGAVYDALLASNGDLYVVGRFTHMGGPSGTAAANIAKYSNGVWSALGTGLNGIGWCLAEAPNGDIYVGGDFTTAGGGAAVRIAMWDGASWNALGAGLDNNVRDIAFAGDGTLVCIGTFQNVAGGGISANRIALWDGATWATLGTGFNGTGDEIKRILSGNTFYVTGSFTTGNSVTLNYICKVDIDNSPYFYDLGGGLGVAGESIAIDRNTNLLTVDSTWLEKFTGSSWEDVSLVYSIARNAITIHPSNGDILIQSDPVTGFDWEPPWKLRGTSRQVHGLDADLAHLKYLNDGSILHFNAGYTAVWGNGIKKTDLSDLGKIFNAKIVFECLKETVTFRLFRINALNQDAYLNDYILKEGEKMEVKLDPLEIVSNSSGNITSELAPGSYLSLPVSGERDISVLAVEYILITNDGSTQILSKNLFKNVNLSNTDNGRIYINIVDDGGGDFHLNFYSNSGRTTLVGHTASEAGLGTLDQALDIIPDGADGIEGVISLTNLSAADTDIYADLGVLETPHMTYNIFFHSIYEALYV